MKPPFRRRAGPSRFLIKSPEEVSSVSARSLYKGWNRKDLQKVLQALKQQQNFESELDLTEIQKKVPQRSLKEIEELIMTLKSRVLQKVYLQVQSQRREERKAKVPVELWAELVQKISRPYEKTISSAFSQMLVIAAIEPCGLMHSDPPHPIIQTPAFSSLQPVQSPKTPSRPSTSDMSPNSSTTRSPSQLQSEAEPTVSSPISTGPVSPSVSPNKHNQVNLELLDHDYLCKPRMLKSVVNFDKIYQYLSDIDSKTCNSALTSMESAVLLDMLMCLPEELSLLDCKELQHHFLQLHSQLTKPAEMPASSSNSDGDVLQANVADATALTPKLGPTTGSTKEPSSESSVTEPAKDKKDKKDWATAGTCPLNPLLVPVALLKRLALDSEK
uniref:snRNA-activating protein complex subunit 2-like n=1 Tax=Sinocyclocheilus grahami TaxID=75366 RepID=A0A672PRC7_SINGR